MNIKKVIVTGATAAVATILLSGCMHDVRKEKNDLLESSKVYQNSKIMSTKEQRLSDLMSRSVQANFIQSTVYYAVSQVGKTLDIDVDSTFRPASEKRLTMNFKGTLGDFLDQVYYQTGIRYKYKNGMLKVTNQKEVEQQFKVKKCRNGKPSIRISLTNVAPEKIFKYMSQKYRLNFSFDIRMSSLKKGKMSFYYTGCDKKEALRKFARAADLDLIWKDSRNILVRDYQTEEFDIPTYFNYKFEDSGAGIGTSGSGSSGGSSAGGGAGGGGSSSGSTVTREDQFREEMLSVLKGYLSPKGKVYLSNRGYAIITDRPSKVRDIKRLIRTERKRQTPIALNVAIIRVDVKDKNDVGVDWNVALNQMANYLNMQGFNASINMADKAAGGLSLTAREGSLQSMVNVLQKYGKTKIVRDFNSKTRAGILTTFKAVDQIPYVISQSTTQDGVAQVSTEARVAEAGLIVNIIPTISGDGEVVNLATDIVVSEYKGDKTFTVNGGIYKLPQISTNNVQMPVRVRVGRSIVLTGFKLSSSGSVNEGIPGASQVGGLFGGLFGHAGEDNQESEFLVVITPKKVKEY